MCGHVGITITPSSQRHRPSRLPARWRQLSRCIRFRRACGHAGIKISTASEGVPRSRLRARWCRCACGHVGIITLAERQRSSSRHRAQRRRQLCRHIRFRDVGITDRRGFGDIGDIGITMSEGDSPKEAPPPWKVIFRDVRDHVDEESRAQLSLSEWPLESMLDVFSVGLLCALVVRSTSLNYVLIPIRYLHTRMVQQEDPQ